MGAKERQPKEATLLNNERLEKGMMKFRLNYV
jgi:hypothetical protein